MVYRLYVEKKENLDNEAKSLYNELKNILQISGLENLRIINRYDVENIDKELFNYCSNTVFSEPQLDNTSEKLENIDGGQVFAVSYLPGQFDQRANSAAECISLISKKERPTVKTAKVYIVYGNVSEAEMDTIKKYVVNPVEAQLVDLKEYKTLKTDYSIPTKVKTLDGFTALDEDGLTEFIQSYGLAMDIDDIKFCQSYFKSEKRNPTITEIKMIDTYWSDHCRHTTFLTTIDNVTFEDKEIEKEFEEYKKIRKELGRENKNINLMDIGTIAAKYLKKCGKLDKLDESEEINACTVKINVDVDNKSEKWLLLFKNETHNHPTEIEPFGGAATCIGGAIRDPLSGRSYVYGAMRVTGAADPLKPVSETIEGKLPQRKIVTTAANGYSSYGNQIGLATGIVDEIYHDGYVAKRMEIGAVIAAAPQKNVRRETPCEGDIIILLGGRTGRDGCGGATGSSKSHSVKSLESCGAEVQKGNAPEERKLQRLFRNEKAATLIKRCNDFGAGGVSVAIGELADGIRINLNAVPKKYDGLDGTELAISESQERMAVVVDKNDAKTFCELANQENLEASIVAVVTKQPRLVMDWNGEKIVDISRDFLNSNGAEKHTDIHVVKALDYEKNLKSESFEKLYFSLAEDLNICSKRGLSERFDSTIGAGSVLMPFGGKYQRTPIQAMVNKISVEKAHTDDCSVMSWGFNPFIMEKSPYHGAYLSVIESVCKLIATGAKFEDVYLTFQEYFEKPKKDPSRWGKPFAALLGALKAQKELEIAAIGGKDSMSGTFENIDVPPTLVSFAVTCAKTKDIVSNEFKAPNHSVVLICPEHDENGLPNAKSLKKCYKRIYELNRAGEAAAIYTPGIGGIAEAVLKMTMGNHIGFEYEKEIPLKKFFGYSYGSFVVELNSNKRIENSILLGHTTDKQTISYNNKKINLSDLYEKYENKLESVFNCNINYNDKKPDNFCFEKRSTAVCKNKTSKPKILIPVFPGTNCEYDTAKAAMRAGAAPDIFVINNLSASSVAQSVSEFAKRIKESQIIFIPGGFSGGDEPDGSGKFITAFFRNEEIKDAVSEMLDAKDGLIGGICNGFQALIKLGLVPYGKIVDTNENSPTLTFNTIGRHQSKIVRTKITSVNSPWLLNTNISDIYNVPISHGEGRFLASDDLIYELAKNGQIITQYVDFDGNATYDINFNPNGSNFAVEGICSPDGRVFGKMGHSERIDTDLYKNVSGNYDMKLFESAVEYFK